MRYTHLPRALTLRLLSVPSKCKEANRLRRLQLPNQGQRNQAPFHPPYSLAKTREYGRATVRSENDIGRVQGSERHVVQLDFEFVDAVVIRIDPENGGLAVEDGREGDLIDGDAHAGEMD